MLLLISSIWFVFFFKQKTAFVMRISDWSSDVCSSDLPHHDRGEGAERADHPRELGLILRHARRCESRLAIARPPHRLSAERTRRHVLPDQYEERKSVV